MVREGICTVELVRADTGAPFKEHTGPDGNVYAEVEPDMDYFIRVGVSEVKKGKCVIVRLTVDGENLGYHVHLEKPLKELEGIWELQSNGMETVTTLSFAKTEGLHARGSSLKPSFGSVKVTFKDADLMEGRIPESSGYVNRWVGGNALVNAAISETTDKVISSREGRKKVSAENHRRPRNFVEGGELATIEIRYCTAVGLILVGVLPKPPGWENRNEKTQQPLSSSMKKCLAVEPWSIVLIHKNDALGQKEVRVDCFDLVEADESDGEEEDFELIEKAQDLNL